MTPHDDELLAEIRRLNDILQALLHVAQGDLLARLIEILADLREIAASTLGYEIK